ncbi:MAG: hypothetical protein PHI06_12295, partial [Desulfobulbaceae bacterium]|nr:hypothetical protein [Desulfobulbaceae bacterium]
MSAQLVPIPFILYNQAAQGITKPTPQHGRDRQQLSIAFLRNKASGTKKKGSEPTGKEPFKKNKFGGDLLSHQVTLAVPSALKSL